MTATVRIVLVALACAVLGAEEFTSDSWLGWLHGSLRACDQERARVRVELKSLGAPVIGQTAPQIGYQHQRLAEQPLTPPWVQVDLLQETSIDTIAIIPAVLDWQSDTKRTTGFPKRFRIDVANDKDFSDPRAIANFTDQDFPDPGVAPVVIRAQGIAARYVRITVTKFGMENGQYIFALGELMVMSGQRNVAVNCPVTAISNNHNPPRWTKINLVDGRTALGPPIEIDYLDWDGLFVGPKDDVPFGYMMLDLGQEYSVQELRLYATHARIGADIPGFLFPPHFRVELATAKDFEDATIVLNAFDEEFPNPGDNAITIRVNDVMTRYVRIRSPDGDGRRWSFSEVEVYSNDNNVAHGATVTRSPDTSSHSGPWPISLLVDGYTSVGRLIPLPIWLNTWERRSQLQSELARLDANRPVLLAEARMRLWWLIAIVTVVAAASFGTWLVVQRRRRAHEMDMLRRRLARDLHDEIGSNLAAIARLSEIGAAQPQHAQAEDWQEVQRIAQESTEGMREVLWLAGAREEAGPDLVTHIHRLVDRLLAGLTVRWLEPLDATPSNWSPSARREVYLFIKESLTNIVRHAQATTVTLKLVVTDHELQLEITDDGQGFTPNTTREGLGMTSLRERARTLGGVLRIHSTPGNGTRISLTVPVSRLSHATANSARMKTGEQSQ